MNDFEKAVFLDFVVRNMHDFSKSDICSVIFLQFGYHQNYKVSHPFNHFFAKQLCPQSDDEGQQAQKAMLNTIVPNILNGVKTLENHPLFGFDVHVKHGFPQIVREDSILEMENPLPHVFELSFYNTNPDGLTVSSTQKTKLRVVFLDNTAHPISLQHMMLKTTLTPPAPTRHLPPKP